MSKLRWSKLWWGDWENDPALRLCSLAAQGLWMRLLCLAASSRVYGQVLVAGRPPTVADIARIVGARPDHVGRLIVELEAHQVFDRTPSGIIQSRRMVADHLQHEVKTRAGLQGGNPALNRVTNPGPPNGSGEDKHVDNRVLKAEAEADGEERLSRGRGEAPPRNPPARGGVARVRSSSQLSPKIKDHFTAIAGDMINEPRSDGADIVPLRKVR